MSDPIADPWCLSRFVEAQSDTYERALAELRDGRKRSHWMWFVFQGSATRRTGVRAVRATSRHTLTGAALAMLAILTLSAFRTSAPRPVHSPPPVEVAEALARTETGDTFVVLRGKVIDVIDGDSVEVQLQSGRIEVRLHAADAPEHDQPGGRAAARALRMRLPRGSEVALEPIEQDQYDRLVAVIEQDGDSVNAWMVQQGQAWAYRRYTSDARYCRWEDAARAAHRGLWSRPPSDWVAPWDWRRRAREPGYRPEDHSRETLDDCVAALRHRRGNKAAGARAPR
jgi:micrococcal nuclease